MENGCSFHEAAPWRLKLPTRRYPVALSGGSTSFLQRHLIAQRPEATQAPLDDLLLIALIVVGHPPSRDRVRASE